MNIQQLREQFAAELKRHRLPRAYIERLLAEWDDHLQDLQEERSTDMARTPEIVKIEDRLGDPAQLAAIAAKQYHHRSFLGRHPILTFLALPLPLIFLVLMAMGALLVLFGNATEGWLKGIKPNEHLLAQNVMCVVVAWVFLVLPPLSAIAFLCRIARRNALNWRWYLASCAIVAIFVGMFQIKWTLETLPHTGMLMVGLGFYISSLSWLLFVFLPKVALAFGVGLLLIKRAQRLQKIDESRAESKLFRQAA